MTGACAKGAPRAVVFDFDGVIADTENLHLSAFQDVFRTRGWTLDRAMYFDRYLGYDDEDLVAEFTRDAKLEVTDGQIREIVLEKTRLYERQLGTPAVIFAGAPAAVIRLGERYLLGIASGSLHAEIDALLEVAGLRSAFRAIVGADDVGRSKPAPDPYVEAVSRLGVAPSCAVAIEDSHWGLASARSAGLRTIGITTSYPAGALGSADEVVGSLDDVTLNLVDRLLLL